MKIARYENDRIMGFCQSEEGDLVDFDDHQKAMQEQKAKRAKLKAEVKGCFDAAVAEGLLEALAETTDERLKDLIERRVLHAYYAVED